MKRLAADVLLKVDEVLAVLAVARSTRSVLITVIVKRSIHFFSLTISRTARAWLKVPSEFISVPRFWMGMRTPILVAVEASWTCSTGLAEATKASARVRSVALQNIVLNFSGAGA